MSKLRPYVKLVRGFKAEFIGWTYEEGITNDDCLDVGLDCVQVTRYFSIQSDLIGRDLRTVGDSRLSSRFNLRNVQEEKRDEGLGALLCQSKPIRGVKSFQQRCSNISVIRSPTVLTHKESNMPTLQLSSMNPTSALDCDPERDKNIRCGAAAFRAF